MKVKDIGTQQTAYEGKLFGFKFSVLESVSSRRNISYVKHAP